MAYGAGLAERVRRLLDDRPGLSEKNMFGGLAFLLNGNMSCGVYGSDLIVCIAPEKARAALQAPGVRVFDMTGRPMKGWLFVGGPAIEDPAALEKWVLRAVNHASSLPQK